jgi:hypothetical protein
MCFYEDFYDQSIGGGIRLSGEMMVQLGQGRSGMR